MTFQKTVLRNYSTGFLGDIVKDGPTRATTALVNNVVSLEELNKVGRIFGIFTNTQGRTPAGVVGEGLGPQKTYGAYNYEVGAGWPTIFGVLGNSKLYALKGGSEGSLSPTTTLIRGTPALFVQETAGMVVELFNAGTTVLDAPFGSRLCFCATTTTAADNPNGVPVGGIAPYVDNIPKGFVAIPNSYLIIDMLIPASAPKTPASLSGVARFNI